MGGSSRPYVCKWMIVENKLVPLCRKFGGGVLSLMWPAKRWRETEREKLRERERGGEDLIAYLRNNKCWHIFEWMNVCLWLLGKRKRNRLILGGWNIYWNEIFNINDVSVTLVVKDKCYMFLK